MENFIKTMITWGLFLAAIGQLKPVTLFLLREAANTHQRGMISFVAMNRALWAGGPVAHGKHSLPNTHHAKTAPTGH